MRMRGGNAVNSHMLSIFRQSVIRSLFLQERSQAFVLTQVNLRVLRNITAMSNDEDHASKKAKTDAAKKIGTHNGTFHCDEVLACFMLKQLSQYKDAEIIRTRDQKVLDTCDIVVDVGAVYDPSNHRYDHHQRSFTDSMNSLTKEKKWTTKLSSAGLVYLHFGHDIIAEILDTSRDAHITKIIYDKTYENFIEEIDAIDNGISQSDEKPRYNISTNLSSRVKNLNSWWNDKDVDVEARFQKAMSMVGSELLDKVNFYHKCWWPARSLVEEAIKKRHEVDKSGEIIVLEQGGCPWKDHLFDLEVEMNVETPIKYVLYTDQNDNWRVQCVPIRSDSFENRLSLHEEWRGIRDDKLSELSGIDGCIFVHASGFIGGNKTREGALQMARKTLENARPDKT
ncbi:MYG1 protein C27H6.8-like [Ptychodera flava]|uniref:MYG1 protein C27H6.8-like n=1 Tax=Ptychodera flava TaxID=63121 RepID=UPI00396AA86B